MLKGFKEFMLKGDLITAAVGLVMALATFALTEALVEDLITPIVAAIIGEPDFSALHFTINGSVFKYGAFINAAIVFVSTAAAVYFFVVVPYKRYQEMKGASVKTRACPECTTEISVAARRCPSCTAVVVPEAG
ncbi:MAG: MscL family protein [Actinobacteria bacterium]|nr:MscL family protein [Actinomycetota bacterium]MBS1884398.1 MscL family protein [Actinomycetota bacterium]